MNDEITLAAVAFAVYTLSSIRRMDRMPATLRLDGADFGLRTPIRAGAARFYVPNPFRPDTCLIDRPVSKADADRIRTLARDLVPFQIAALLSAATVWIAMPYLAGRMPLLPVLIGTFVMSGCIVVGSFVVSSLGHGIAIGRSDAARIVLAAVISPPVAANLARDVARAHRCRS